MRRTRAGEQLFSYGDFGISRLMIRVRLPNTLTWVMCQNLPTNMITSTRNTNVEMACPDVCQNLIFSTNFPEPSSACRPQGYLPFLIRRMDSQDLFEWGQASHKRLIEQSASLAASPREIHLVFRRRFAPVTILQSPQSSRVGALNSRSRDRKVNSSFSMQ
jgi:hypothetical protein